MALMNTLNLTPGLSHRQRELNMLMDIQQDFEEAGMKLGKKHFERVKFVAACIATLSAELGD